MAPVDHLKPLQWLDVTEDGVDRIKNWKSKLYKNLLEYLNQNELETKMLREVGNK